MWYQYTSPNGFCQNQNRVRKRNGSSLCGDIETAGRPIVNGIDRERDCFVAYPGKHTAERRFRLVEPFHDRLLYFRRISCAVTAGVKGEGEINDARGGFFGRKEIRGGDGSLDGNAPVE